MTIPDWVQKTVFYQIFPDRFANGNLENDPSNLQPWDARPTVWGFQGGDLAGIQQRLEYLLDLGINAIYLNPIFRSTSNHRYNITDYLSIDPRLGSQAEFLGLLENAHHLGIRIVLDGVFNHSGRGFFAFNDILENQANSPYQDWYTIRRFPVDAYSPGEAKDYACWWNLKSLPKFNTNNPRVRDYLMNAARYWTNLGIDGWRLDVPNEIDDDSFWAEFRETVKSSNPDAFLFGEIWEQNPRWVGGEHFDGLMNYPLRKLVIDWLKGGISSTRLIGRAQENVETYPWENMLAMYNLVGSHDTERIMTLMDNDVSKVQAAMLFQFAFPGVPAIYYGDEIGLTGGKDPDCRGTFPWDRSSWKKEIYELTQRLCRIRKERVVLQRGTFLPGLVDDDRKISSFFRVFEREVLLAIINGGPTTQELTYPLKPFLKDISLPAGFTDLLANRNFGNNNGAIQVSLPPGGGLWLANYGE